MRAKGEYCFGSLVNETAAYNLSGCFSGGWGSAGTQPERRLKSGQRQAGPLSRRSGLPCRSQFQSEKSILLCHPCGYEKLQLIKRLPAPIIRHLLAGHRNDQLTARAAAHEWGLSRPRFYKLYGQYLRACAQGQAAVWSPGVSGGDHQSVWPAEVAVLLTKLLASKPPSSYSACASELQRRLQFETNRASVRRWAIENQLAPDTRYKAAPKPVKRWQARALGALWQDDASPHAWLPGQPDKQAPLDILDDATRYNTGARLYPGETLLAHFDFLARVFQAHGLPLAL